MPWQLARVAPSSSVPATGLDIRYVLQAFTAQTSDIPFVANIYELGPLGVGHGETSCILLPAVCKFNAKHNANRGRQTRVREFLVRDPVLSEVLRSQSVEGENLDLADILHAVICHLGMPRSLRDVGLGRDVLDGLAESSLHDRWCRTNPVPLNEKSQVLEILEMVV